MNKEFSLDLLEKDSDYLEFLTDVSNKNPNDRPIVLFGAGAWGVCCYSAIEKYFKTVLFCDNNPDKWGTTLIGVPIISLDSLKNIYTESNIIITSLDYYDQILQQLTEHGMQDRVLQQLKGFTHLGFADYYNTVSKHKADFEKTYSLLADDYSRQIFFNRINSCITANNKYLFPLRSNSPQYFEDGIVKLSGNEIFVDGGAYTGDTVEEFLQQTEGKFEKIYSFEPEDSKHLEFHHKFSNNQKIELIPYGLWKENDILKFDALDNGSSGVNEEGGIEIKVVSIDDTLKDTPVTFIKMDIEGSELEALEGAEQTIRRYKPKLAICIYHKPLDIVQIPLFLKEIVPEYKIYIRHYSVGIGETVCYAIAE
ncbi:FkbM family methyltransferase [Paenibacillus sp. NPDC057934]|uniref:FkbM family methyltransferase n=1 Tax=Paenibacillus sp. NPDC057934 TaxID=3346282 RepID=UPI0036DE6018